jgi:hypothetical protein
MLEKLSTALELGVKDLRGLLIRYDPSLAIVMNPSEETRREYPN